MKTIYLSLLISGVLGTSSAMAQAAQQAAAQAAQTDTDMFIQKMSSVPYPGPAGPIVMADKTAFRKNVLATQVEREYTVDKVIDGDTFEVVTSGGRVTFRLVGIDAPEEGQENWKEAKDKLSEMIQGKKVTARYSSYYPQHMNGFFIVRVFVDKNDAGAFMLNNGWAWYDRTYSIFFNKKEHEENIKAMKNAKSAKLGIWRNDKAEEPWEYFAKAQMKEDKAARP
jgi:endonuclease YncB( thermonuclease family)